jgi:hypothetical protein
VHAAAPPLLYRPGGQGNDALDGVSIGHEYPGGHDSVAADEPSGQKNDAGHDITAGDVEPVEQTKPAVQGPEHAELVAPLTLPKRPPGQSTHTAAAASE